MISTSGGRQVVSERIYREVSDFLYREAQLLDDGRYGEWLELLDEEIQYRLVGSSAAMSGPTGQNQISRTLLMEETFGTFRVRVQQLSTPAFTIVENPRPFTRRFISNVLVDDARNNEPLTVHSYALVLRTRGNSMEPHLFSLSRRDLLRRAAGKLRLLRRDAQLDESSIGARNIAALW